MIYQEILEITNVKEIETMTGTKTSSGSKRRRRPLKGKQNTTESENSKKGEMKSKKQLT
jgi:hypothetical protein